ncbi:RNA polymerase-associated protein LEO1 [Drosophila willistoni]|uniref:RNA polymerase-associated protein LEO1 n=1 Tax=Drosophila willistoni TaxID=7260 RepID=UPI00017D8F13|nr:RNA polymerase-associated protein LEO1 [Drosophila willistoni]
MFDPDAHLDFLKLEDNDKEKGAYKSNVGFYAKDSTTSSQHLEGKRSDGECSTSSSCSSTSSRHSTNKNSFIVSSSSEEEELPSDISYEEDDQEPNETKADRDSKSKSNSVEVREIGSLDTSDKKGNQEPNETKAGSDCKPNSNSVEGEEIGSLDETNAGDQSKYQLSVEFKATLPSIGNLIEGHSQFLRMPIFIPIEPIAYNDKTYTSDMSAEDLKSEQSRENFVSRLKTTVRWRENQNDLGKLCKESNARIVRWSDGSETFHVGAEVFDIMHHPVPDDQNQLYVRLDDFYQVQTSIKDKMTLRPKLDSSFGQSHVQGLRNRAMNKPQTGCVKVLMDMGINPILDRERKIKEELAQMKKEDRDKRRMQQLNLKPRIKPMRHCTADDSDLDDIDEEENASAIAMPMSSTSQATTSGIRTNRNAASKPEFEETDSDDKNTETEDEEDDDDDTEDEDDDDDNEEENDDDDESDIMDIINDGDPGYEEEVDTDDSRSNEKKQSKVQKKKKNEASETDSDDSEVGMSTKRKPKLFFYSDSDE